MANEEVFSVRAESYAKGRFGYAPGVFDLLRREVLRPGCKIADVGSGTGLFARELIALGYDVFCVEPNQDMRAQAQRQLGGDPHYIPVIATAEATTLPDHSIDLVTVASAFHWFDPDRFQAECKRILRPGGVLFAVNNRRGAGDPLSDAQHELCRALCPNYSSLHHGIKTALPHYERIFGPNLRHASFDFPLDYSKERYIQRCLSSSYAPLPGSPEYDPFLSELRKLLDRFAPDSDHIIIPNASVVYWGVLP